MTSQLDLFAPATPAKRRGKWCTRDVDAGPGSCWHYWDLCPAKVQGCYTREVLTIAERHNVRHGDAIPPAMQAEINAMHARRRAEAAKA